MLALACACLAASAQPPGQSVGTAIGFNGKLGASTALLLVNGELHAVHVGQSFQGVQLLSIEGDTAIVEINGRRRELTLGAQPASVGDAGGGSSSHQIVIAAGSGGHFTTLGAINGHSVQFLVDTGATLVALSQSEAERLGLHYREEGHATTTQTANGSAAAYRLLLDSVRVGSVEVHNVDAIVVASPMPFVLLGNSFLSRFEMRRENDMLTLVQRY